MSDAESQFAKLSPAKQALLARMKRNAVHTDDAIPVRRQMQAPLSSAQKRLWFLDQFYPRSCAYNVPRVFRIRGNLNTSALKSALQSIVQRHEILRTTFKLVNNEPVQIVGNRSEVPLASCDLSATLDAKREASAESIIRAEIARPFDLSSDLMLRATLIKLLAEEHVLILMTHHIASDGWSKGVMFRELAALYNAAINDQTAQLPELPIQYSDFALWQNEWLKEKRMQDQLAYWKKQLEGAPALLELPTDYPRPAVQGFDGAAEYCVLPGSLVQRLKTFSQKEGVTLFMTLLASFQALLSRYTNQQDIVVGTPIAGRTRSELEPLIGDFVNMLAIRTSVSGDLNFKELVRSVKETLLHAHDNQDLPFESLVEELEHGRDLSRAPVFQTIFILDAAPAPPPAMHGLDIELLDFEPLTPKNDLILHLVDDPAGMKVKLEYRTDLFQQSSMRRFLQRFERFLESIITNPEQAVGTLGLLSAEEQQLLAKWNNTGVEQQHACIHQLFEAQCARTPDAVAVQFADSRLTYAELNRRSNQLANYLKRMGVAPDSRVGICVHRSLEMVVGLLGILKAGAAYVPLDPAYPRERLEFMLQDSGARVLITQQSLLGLISAGAANVICIDRDAPAIALESSEDLSTDVTPENLSYVIFTSGSTGKPKGVQLEHRNLANFLNSVRRLSGLAENDVYLGVASMSFDASVMDFYLPLTTGAALVITDAETTRDAASLARIISQRRVTAMHATPSTWRNLMDAGWTGDGKLKIFSGGEALPWDLATQLLPCCSVLWNLYGPTETAVYSVIHRVAAADGTVLVGRPIDNTQVYILDAHQQQMPVGLPGEIYIVGAGVARGYLNRPELTSEKFLSNPFGDSARMYRTGDLGRYRADGVIECLGRIDHQVKLRGYRIELGEIEAVLRQYPGVRDAVADVRITSSGDKRLVAYLVLAEPGPKIEELRSFLKLKLPDYMIPSWFLTLDSLPLSPNGKVNRNALPDPDTAYSSAEPSFEGPVTPVEQAIAEIFAEVLEIPRVGLRHDFFELGGHSLLATRVVSRLRERFQVEMTPRFLFESPTVAEMSARISNLLVADSNPEELASLLAELEEN